MGEVGGGGGGVRNKRRNGLKSRVDEILVDPPTSNLCAVGYEIGFVVDAVYHVEAVVIDSLEVAREVAVKLSEGKI